MQSVTDHKVLKSEQYSRRKSKKKTIKRPMWMWLHTVLSSFFLPASLIFLITGALLPFHIRGKSDSVTHELIFEEPVDTTHASMLTALENELTKRSITHLFGTIKFNKNTISWTDTNKYARLKLKDAGLDGELKIVQYSFFQKLIRFHFALSPPIKIFAVSITIAATLVFLSGFVLAIQVKSLRRTTVIWTTLGMGVTVLLFIVA